MMGYFLSLRIGSKLMLAFLLLIACCGATLYQGILTLDRFQSELDSVSRRFNRIADIKELKTNLARQNQLVLQLIIQKTATQNADLQTIELLQQQNNELLSNIQLAQGSIDEVKLLVKEVQDARSRYKDFIQYQILPGIKATEYDQSWLLMSEQGASLTKEIELKTAALEKLTDKLVQQSLQNTEQEFFTLTQRMAMFSLLMVGTGLLLSWLLSLHIARPLACLAAMAEQIGRGELPKDVPLSARRDEVGRLSLAFASMNLYLRGLVQEKKYWP
jgi:nitrogen fixation/metabolism regulation signal transduction histidine kinase